MKKKQQTPKQNDMAQNKFRQQGMYADHLRKFNSCLNQYGLFINDVEADGNCLFRAIADQLDNSERSYAKYRKLASIQIRKRKSFYSDFLPENVTIESYIDQMSRDGTWGGHIELQALTEELGIQIVVHSIDSFVVVGEQKQEFARPCCFCFYRCCSCILSICNDYRYEKKINQLRHKTIHIAFQKGDGFQKHYSSVKGHNFSLPMLQIKGSNLSQPRAPQIQNECEESCSFQPNSIKTCLQFQN